MLFTENAANSSLTAPDQTLVKETATCGTGKKPDCYPGKSPIPLQFPHTPV
jgi:hypothetical protein